MQSPSRRSAFEVIARGEVRHSVYLDALNAIIESKTIGLDETFHGGFRVRRRDASRDYKIIIGDDALDVDGVPVEALEGTADLGQDVVWRDGWHFESCVGVVYVQLLSRQSSTNEPWQSLLQLRVNVLPSKLGWDRYNDLLRDVKKVSAALIFDLVSKNKNNIGFSGVGIAAEPSNIQLRRIEKLWADLKGVLPAIIAEPAVIIARKYMASSTDRSTDCKSVARALGRGICPSGGFARYHSLRPVESLETHEHAFIKTVLQLLVSRLTECNLRASAQAAHLRRDLPVWLDPEKAPEIIANEYTPRIVRLDQLAALAAKLRSEVCEALAASPFKEAKAIAELSFSPVFQHVVSYNFTFRALLSYLRTSLWTLDDGLEERVKRTSRLYEHWVFIQIAAALISLNYECVQSEGLFSIAASNRFTLDLDKGTLLVFKLSGGRTLRVRYEPWVFSKAVAMTMRDGIYGPSAYAWNPDVVIELCAGQLENGAPNVIYVVVVDAKYTNRIAEHHWGRVSKYWKIRSVSTGKQVAMQLWLAFAGSEAAKPVDDCVTWGEPGDMTEHIDGTVGLLPSDHHERDGAIPVCSNALAFVRGLLRFLGESDKP